MGAQRVRRGLVFALWLALVLAAQAAAPFIDESSVRSEVPPDRVALRHGNSLTDTLYFDLHLSASPDCDDSPNPLRELPYHSRSALAD